MNLTSSFLLSATLLLSIGCTMGPNYTRPSLNAPGAFRFGGKSKGQSLGDLDWRTAFKDPLLKGLIEEALANNLDLVAAAARVEQARANLAVVRSRFFPTIGAAYNYSQTEVSSEVNLGSGSIPLNFDTKEHAVGVSLLQYEVDFWGKIRRSTEAARARLVATEEGRRIIQVNLIASVASAYVALREQDHELEIARRTLESRKKSFTLIDTRYKGGQSALTDVKQAEVLVAEAEAAISAAERQIGVLENQICYLLGRSPGSIRRGKSFDMTSIITAVPAGLPSELLNRRPDIRAAEQALVAATAEIGVAQAQRLPSFTLTAGAGLRSKEFSGLFDNPTRLWQIGPSIDVPVFTGGRLLAAVRGSKAARDEAEADYRQTVLQALREVSDALIERQKGAGVTEAQGRVVKARQEALALIVDRYNNGATSYLEVLYNDQQLFGAELAHARARLEEITATIDLYRALGGGWDRGSIPEPISGK